MKSLLSLLMTGIIFSIPAFSQAGMSSKTEFLFNRVQDITGKTFVTRELSEAVCADPQGYLEGQSLITQKLEQLKAEEVEIFSQYINAEDTALSIRKTVLKKQSARKSYEVIIFAQRKSFVDQAAIKGCQ